MSIVNRLRHAPAAVRRVIDIGCGAGATTRALSDAGFDAIGIEPSLALLEMARVAAPRAEFRHASVYEVDLPPCEAVLAVGEPLTYHPPSVDADAALQRLIRTVADVLPLGGVFVFDVIVAAGPPLDARGWRSGDDWAILYEVTEDRPTRRMTRSIETFRKSGPLYRRAHEVHHVRLFEEQALRSWLIRAGFEVETAHSYGDQPLPPQRVAFFATRCECRDSIETR